MFPHPIPASTDSASTIANGPIAYPFVVGCAGRCGRLCAVHFPQDAQLRDLAAELVAQGWRLASAEFGGGQIDAVTGFTDHAVAPLCSECHRHARTGTRRPAAGRASTVRR
jgi:hypothetical protein